MPEKQDNERTNEQNKWTNIFKNVKDIITVIARQRSVREGEGKRTSEDKNIKDITVIVRQRRVKKKEDKQTNEEKNVKEVITVIARQRLVREREEKQTNEQT